MKRVSGLGDVSRAITAVQRQLKAAQKQINQQAARALARGDYTTAEEFVAVGRSTQEFAQEVTQLAAKWRELKSSSGNESTRERLPLWTLYKPLLKAVISLDGEATINQLESSVPPMGGIEAGQWRNKLRQARRAMIEEGFLTNEKSKWIITDEGRGAAKG